MRTRIVAGIFAWLAVTGLDARAQAQPPAFGDTYVAFQKACNYLTATADCSGTLMGSAKADGAIPLINTVELNYLVFRAGNPDSADPTKPNPHTPVAKDAILVNTGAALGYLSANVPHRAASSGKSRKTPAPLVDMTSALLAMRSANITVSAYTSRAPPPYSVVSVAECLRDLAHHRPCT